MGLVADIVRKQQELAYLVEEKKSLLDKEVYAKSLELDRLVVQYMRGQANPKAASL